MNRQQRRSKPKETNADHVRRLTSRPPKVENILLQRPDGKFEETFYIANRDLLLSIKPEGELMGRVVGYANQVGRQGRIVREWRIAQHDGGQHTKVVFLSEWAVDPETGKHVDEAPIEPVEVLG